MIPASVAASAILTMLAKGLAILGVALSRRCCCAGGRPRPLRGMGGGDDRAPGSPAAVSTGSGVANFAAHDGRARGDTRVRAGAGRC